MASNPGHGRPQQGQQTDSENPLEPSAVFHTLVQSLPRFDESNGFLKSAAELVMVLYHAAMVQYGFRFLGIGEERKGKLLPSAPVLPCAVTIDTVVCRSR